MDAIDVDDDEFVTNAGWLMQRSPHYGLVVAEPICSVIGKNDLSIATRLV